MNNRQKILLIAILLVALVLLTSATSKSSFPKKLIEKLKAKNKRGVYVPTVREAQAFADVAIKNGFRPEWLANLVNFETAGTFSPAIQNPSSGATGLIQFMPATARSLGTSTDALKQMSFLQQLYYVDLYLKKSVKNAKERTGKKDFSQIDLFMIVFYPVAVGNPDYQFPGNVVRANGGISTPLQYTERALRNKLF